MQIFPLFACFGACLCLLLPRLDGADCDSAGVTVSDIDFDTVQGTGTWPVSFSPFVTEDPCGDDGLRYLAYTSNFTAPKGPGFPGQTIDIAYTIPGEDGFLYAVKHIDYLHTSRFDFSGNSNSGPSYTAYDYAPIHKTTKTTRKRQRTEATSFTFVANLSQATNIDVEDPIPVDPEGIAYQIDDEFWQSTDVIGRIKTCPGKYRITLFYKKYPLDGSIPNPEPPDSEYTDTREFSGEDEMPANGYEVRMPLPTSECFRSVFVRMEYRPEGACGDTTSPVASGQDGIKSIHSTTNLGRLPAGGNAGSLYLHSETVDSGTFSPRALTYLPASDDAEVNVVRDANGALRQLHAPDALVDITEIEAAPGMPSGFKISFYAPPPPPPAAPDTLTGLYIPSTAPFATVKYENPDAPAVSLASATKLKITRESAGLPSEISLFTRESGNTLSLAQGDGRLKIVQSKTVSGDDTIERTERFAPANASAPDSVETTITRQFPFGRRIVEKSKGTGAAKIWTAFHYETAPLAADYGRLRALTSSNGGWERYAYASGNLSDIWRPLADADVEETDGALLSHEQIIRSQLPASPYGAGRLTTTITSEAGVEVRRRHHFQKDASTLVVVGDANYRYLARHKIDVEAAVLGEGQPWHAADNSLTHNYIALMGDKTGQAIRTDRPDGQTTLLPYNMPATPTNQITETWNGAPNPGWSNLIAGTRVTTTRSPSGLLLSKETRDVATNLVIEALTYADHDAFGRPLTVLHFDGSEETREYNPCCGQLTKLSHNGVSTYYGYDTLRRREWERTETDDVLLSRTSFTYDSEGRLLTRTRIPVSGPAQLLERNLYDNAGTLISRATPGSTLVDSTLTRVGTYSSVYDSPTGRTTRTLTRPDGATEIEVNDRAGRLLLRTGSAVFPVRYEYGTSVLPDAGQWGQDPATPFAFTREIKLGAAGTDTPEMLTSFFDPLGRTIKTVHADGAATRSFYDAAGRLLSQIDPDGVRTLFSYSHTASGKVRTAAINLSDADPAFPAIDLDGLDRVKRSTQVVSTRTEGGITYTVNRTLAELWETDNDATPTAFVTESTPDGLRTWQTAYGLTTRTRLEKDPDSGESTETTIFPDGTGTVRVLLGARLQSETRKDSAGATVTRTEYGYDAHGRSESQTLVGSGPTLTAYYADDQPRAVTSPDPDPARTWAGYDPQTTTYAYDLAGRVTTVTSPDATQTFTTYWPTGKVKRTWGGRTHPAEHAYDAQGRLKSLTTWQNFASAAGAAVTTWNYHAQRGWLSNKRHTDGSGPDYDYWPSGRLKTRDWARSVSGARLRTAYSYDAAGDLAGIDYADSTPDVTHVYDRIGRPKTTTDAAGQLTRDYARGLLDDEVYAAGSSILSGLEIMRELDDKNRLDSIAASSVPALEYGYDSAGRPGALTRGAKVATLGYKAQTGTHESTVITTAGVPRHAFARTTDALGRVTRSDVASIPSLRRDYEYNNANQRIEAAQADGAHWVYAYDALGQVTDAEKRDPGANPLPGYEYGYAYDTIGNRVGATVNGRAATYVPDLLNRYVSRDVPPAFDVLGSVSEDVNVLVEGKPTSRSGGIFHRVVPVANGSGPVFQSVEIIAARPDSPDEVARETRTAFVAQTPEAFAYDLDGNLLQDGLWTYVWDAENRLIEATTRSTVADGLPTLPRQKLVFAYDSQGRRIRKRSFAWSGGSWAGTPASDLRFVYDGWNLLGEYDGLAGNALIRSHAWGLDLSGSAQGAGGIGGLLWTDTATAAYAPAWDANGNIIAWIDLADGTLAGVHEYGAFGENVASTGVATTLPFGFSGKYRDAETNLYYYGLRFYSPGTGRWQNRDPLYELGGNIAELLPEGANLYGFVGNYPTGDWDYLGLIGGGRGGGSGSTGKAGPLRGGGSSAGAASIIDQVRQHLPTVEGELSLISWTLVWVPYPGGRWSVDVGLSGAVMRCRHPDGRKGLMADVTVEVSTQAGFGYGAGGNQGMRRAGKNKLRDSRGRYAKNPEKGPGTPEFQGSLASECEPCENTLDGSLTIEVGGKAGAYLSFNPYANVTFAFSDPIDFDYGIRAGASTYVGAELYLRAAAAGSGTLVIQ